MLGYEATITLLKEFGIPLADSVFVPARAEEWEENSEHGSPRGGCEAAKTLLAARAGDVATRFIAGADSDGHRSASVASAASTAAVAAAEAHGDGPGAGRVAMRGIGFGQGSGGSGVALKLLAPGFSHKSDSGFVALDLDSRDAVESRALAMLSRLPVACVPEGFLVQPMIRGGREVFMGAQVDAQFGPVVAFGPGGILVELLGGVDFLRPPFGREEAALFVRRNPAWPILEGARGAGRADLGAILDVLVGLGNLMLANAGIVGSVDLNPFIAFDEGSGGLALDARIQDARIQDAGA